jgi:hypothetical protein
VPVHRRTATGDVWFLYNDSARPSTRTLRFATTGAPTQIDLWSGEATRLAHFTERGGRVSLPVTLGPAATAVLTFEPAPGGCGERHVDHGGRRLVRGSRLVLRDFRGGRQTAVLRDGRHVGATLPTLPGPRSVTGPWRLVATTVAPEGDARVERRLPALADWRDIPGLESKSGTGTYTATVDLPCRLGARRPRRAPGCGSLRRRPARLGQRPFGARSARARGRAPRRHEPAAPGRNALRLEVSTTLNNAMRAHAQLGDPSYASYVSRPVQDAGLSGPCGSCPTPRPRWGRRGRRRGARWPDEAHGRSRRGAGRDGGARHRRAGGRRVLRWASAGSVPGRRRRATRGSRSRTRRYG